MATQGSSAAIALDRFGLGARPDEKPPANLQKYLLNQLYRFEVRPLAYATLPDANELAQQYVEQQRQQRQAKRAADPKDGAEAKTPLQMVRLQTRDAYRSGVNARLAAALASETPFVERLTHFWANHFALSVEKPQVSIFSGAYEFDAIRPHVLGRFEDMLVAVERHPAMLFYLDQFRSVGPNSPAAQRAVRNANRQLGLNENLAREIMELHTLGVRSGYNQADVAEFARALTGWSIGGQGPLGGRDGGSIGDFMFRPGIHEPGTRTIVNKVYDQPGEDQARAILHDLALSPATARHISTKLARHFVADDPPPALVDRLARRFLETGGDLPAVYRVLVEAPERGFSRRPNSRARGTGPYRRCARSAGARSARSMRRQCSTSWANRSGAPDRPPAMTTSPPPGPRRTR